MVAVALDNAFPVDKTGRHMHLPESDFGERNFQKNPHWAVSLRHLLLSLVMLAVRASVCHAVIVLHRHTPSSRMPPLVLDRTSSKPWASAWLWLSLVLGIMMHYNSQTWLSFTKGPLDKRHDTYRYALSHAVMYHPTAHLRESYAAYLLLPSIVDAWKHRAHTHVCMYARAHAHTCTHTAAKPGSARQKWGRTPINRIGVSCSGWTRTALTTFHCGLSGAL